MPKPVNVWELIKGIRADIHSYEYEISVGIRWPEKSKTLEFIDIVERDSGLRVVRIYFDPIGTNQLDLGETVMKIVQNWEAAKSPNG